MKINAFLLTILVVLSILGCQQIVTDGGDNTPTPTPTENLTPPNKAPAVDAGIDQSITLPVNQVTLDGTVTDDGYPDPPCAVTTIWTKTSGPGTVTFENSSLVDTSATFSIDGTYVLRLTANDSELETYDEITVTVNLIPCPTNPNPSDEESIIDTTPLLDWEDISESTGYHIQVNTNSDFSGTNLIDDNSLTNSQYQISTVLADNQIYYWRVRVKITGEIWGDWCNIWKFKVEIPPPINPNPINGSYDIDIKPLFDWEDINGALNYHIQLSTNSNFVILIIDDDTLPTSQYTVTTALSLDMTYYWRVRVENSDNVWGNWSEVWSFSTVKFRVKWYYTTSDYIDSSPAIGSDGTIYVGSNDSTLYAINPDGTHKWGYSTGGYIESSPAIGSDGTIYVGSADHKLRAINPDGSRKWYYTTDGVIVSSPAIGSDGTIYVGSYDYKLYAINQDGTLKWTYATDRKIESSPVVGSDGTIYVGSSDKNLYAINPNGSLKWSYSFNDEIITSPAIGSDSTIYVSLDGGEDICAINPDGTLKWCYSTGTSKILSSPTIGSDGTIYFGLTNYNLNAIDSNGNLKWVYTTNNSIFSTPAIGSDGTIYVGSRDKNIYAINPDGTLKWYYTTGDDIRYSSPAIGSDGTIYIGSRDNNLYAIESDCAGLADTSWPMFHHDVKHTGRK